MRVSAARLAGSVAEVDRQGRCSFRATLVPLHPARPRASTSICMHNRHVGDTVPILPHLPQTGRWKTSEMPQCSVPACGTGTAGMTRAS